MLHGLKSNGTVMAITLIPTSGKQINRILTIRKHEVTREYKKETTSKEINKQRSISKEQKKNRGKSL